MVDNRLIHSMIDPQVFVGTCPRTVDDVEHLRQQLAITAVLTLQTDDDRRLYRLDWAELQRAYEHEGIRVYELPILDRDEDALAERLPEAVELLEDLIRQEHLVFLHCNIGNGRSPTVAAAWLHWRRGWGLARAVAHLKDCRRCEPNAGVIRRAAAMHR